VEEAWQRQNVEEIMLVLGWRVLERRNKVACLAEGSQLYCPHQKPWLLHGSCQNCPCPFQVLIEDLLFSPGMREYCVGRDFAANRFAKDDLTVAGHEGIHGRWKRDCVAQANFCSAPEDVGKRDFPARSPAATSVAATDIITTLPRLL
jgi:hypothetical protein